MDTPSFIRFAGHERYNGFLPAPGCAIPRVLGSQVPNPQVRTVDDDEGRSRSGAELDQRGDKTDGRKARDGG